MFWKIITFSFSKLFACFLNLQLCNDTQSLVPCTENFEQCWNNCHAVYEENNKGRLFVTNLFTTECLETWNSINP